MAERRKQRQEPRPLTSAEAAAAGGFGGMCNIAASQPLDVTKVMMQNDRGSSRGAVQTAAEVVRASGVRGLYAGMLLPLIGVVPVFAAMFGVYDGACKRLAKLPRFQHHGPHYDVNRVNLLGAVVAGVPAGLSTSTLLCIGERVKCLLQVDASAPAPRYTGVGDVLRQLHAEAGLRSLFKGMVPTVCREVVGASTFFGCAAGLRATFSQLSAADDHDDEIHGFPELRPELSGLAGGLAGAAQWTVQLPMDTVKTRMQTTDMTTMTSVRAVLRDIWVMSERSSARSVQLLYAGWGPAVGRAFVGTGACFLGIDAVGRVFRLLSP